MQAKIAVKIHHGGWRILVGGRRKRFRMRNLLVTALAHDATKEPALDEPWHAW